MATVDKSTIIIDAKNRTQRAFKDADSGLRKLDASTKALGASLALVAGGAPCLSADIDRRWSQCEW